jgi:hypothetical protein
VPVHVPSRSLAVPVQSQPNVNCRATIFRLGCGQCLSTVGPVPVHGRTVQVQRRSNFDRACPTSPPPVPVQLRPTQLRPCWYLSNVDPAAGPCLSNFDLNFDLQRRPVGTPVPVHPEGSHSWELRCLSILREVVRALAADTPPRREWTRTKRPRGLCGAPGPINRVGKAAIHAAMPTSEPSAESVAGPVAWRVGGLNLRVRGGRSLRRREVQSRHPWRPDLPHTSPWLGAPSPSALGSRPTPIRGVRAEPLSWRIASEPVKGQTHHPHPSSSN